MGGPQFHCLKTSGVNCTFHNELNMLYKCSYRAAAVEVEVGEEVVVHQSEDWQFTAVHMFMCTRARYLSNMHYTTSNECV